KRGPVERVAPTSAAATSSASAFSDPMPRSGIPPSNSGAPDGRTSASSTLARKSSASRAMMRSASAMRSRSRIGSGIVDTIDRVLAVVVDESRVVIPVRAAPAARHLLRPDHHVVDPVFARQVERGGIAGEDLLVVHLLLHVVGKAVCPQPARVAHEHAPGGQRRDWAVVLVG